jgi:exodeoxyribonuclease VII small subunit
MHHVLNLCGDVVHTGYVLACSTMHLQLDTTASSADTAPVSYEAALKELEGLVQQMESGQLPLADLLSGYQRGAELLGYCRAQLDAVEQQIKVLDNGALKTWTPT